MLTRPTLSNHPGELAESYVKDAIEAIEEVLSLQGESNEPE